MQLFPCCGWEVEMDNAKETVAVFWSLDYYEIIRETKRFGTETKATGTLAAPPHLAGPQPKVVLHL